MGLIAVWALVGGLWALPGGAQTPLDWPRQLYNQGRFDQAIVAAARQLSNPALADAAGLVIGRSHLERFRRSGDRADLVAGREALTQLRASALASRDQLEYLLGLGEALFLEESYGPAAELFETALARGADVDVRTADRVFDWWASALDRQAQAGTGSPREGVYARMAERAAAWLGRYPGAGAPAYWLVVAYRSLGQLDQAWDAAVAGWLRAPLTADQGVTLRADLDRVVLLGIIPERVRQEQATDRDRERAAASLRSAWEAVKREWAPKQPRTP